MSKKMILTVAKIKAASFYAMLFAFSFIGLLWFLRPSVSDVEKRELTKFPELSMSGLIDGSYLKGVDLWYADTYPLREQLIECNSVLRSFYGDRSSQFIDKGEQPGDDIPDIPTRPQPTGTESPEQTEAPGTTGPIGTEQPGTEPPVTEAQTTEPPTTDPQTTHPPTTESPVDPGVDPMQGEMAGSVYVVGDTGYRIYFFNRKNSERYAAMINSAAEKFKGKATVYCMIPPLNGILLDQSAIDKLGASDQGRAIEYMYALMNTDVRVVDAYGSITAHKNEYIYFRTDHHWTALGAYYAYTAFAKVKGVTAHTLDMFERREYPGFLGSGYSASQSQAMKNNPDTVIAYVPFGTNTMTMIQKDGKSYTWRIVNNVSNYKSGSKYACFSGGDKPYSFAHNPNINDGSACVLIKDSYGNAFVPFLIDHYEYTYWIDYRYYKGTLTDLVNEKGIDDIIFGANIYSTGASGAIGHMEDLLR